MLFGFFKKKEKPVPKFKCAKCGSENPMDAKFCLSCGAGLGEQKTVQSKVAEATAITEDFKDKGGFWAKIIPGYHGYKKKEIRRESDRLMRDHLVKQMTNTKNELDAIAEEAATSNPDLVMKIEDMRTELD
nr:zinc-ribbon domain-containing protein [Candidatus Sigynarchaeota archaeon]